MDINCSENSFKDVAVGTKELNEFNNNDLAWKDPNGDKLILDVIEDVCNFSDGQNQKIKMSFTNSF